MNSERRTTKEITDLENFLYYQKKSKLSSLLRSCFMRHSSFIKSVYQVLLIIVVLSGFSTSVFSQGYIVEIQGAWKKDNGAIVENRQKISAGTRINNISNQSGDSIFIADASGEIVASCSNDCKSIVIPSTESWGVYLWCKIFGCGSKKYTTFAVKGAECNNLDGIAFINQNGVTDLSAFLKLLSNKSDRLNLKFQKKVGDNIEEKVYDVKVSNPQVIDLKVGFYDVIESKITSRILILPTEIYEREKQSLAEIQNKISSWREKGLSNCTIKTFTQSYLDYVAKKYEAQIKKDKKKIEAKS